MSDNGPEPALLPATVKPRSRTALRRMLGLIPGLLVLLVSMRLLEAALPVHKQTTGFIASLLCLVLGLTLCIVGPLAMAPLSNTPHGPRYRTPFGIDRTKLDRLWRKLEWHDVRSPYWVNAAPVPIQWPLHLTGVFYERSASPDQMRLNVLKFSSRDYYLVTVIVGCAGVGVAIAGGVTQQLELMVFASSATLVAIGLLSLLYRSQAKMQPWVVIDPQTQRLNLPNSLLSIPLASVDRWQLIHCIADDMNENSIHLAVVVRREDQQLTRHLITGVSYDERQHIKGLVVDSEIPLDEIVLGGKNPLRRDKLHPDR